MVFGCEVQWHPAITKCHGTEKRGLRYSEDPVVTIYLVNSKNIRYSGVIYNNQKFNTTHLRL